jgi:hypothetical protein
MGIRRAVVGGLAGTAVMTMLMLMAPRMGMPEMNIGAMLGGFLGIGTAIGWVMHFMIGTVLAVIFSIGFARRLPGPMFARGAQFAILPFLVAQLVMMPMMGAGVFSGGNFPMVMGSLMGHLVYGGVLGAVYGPVRVAAPAAA